MRLQVVAIGTKMPSWVNSGVEYYQKQLPTICQLEIRQIAATKRTKSSDIARLQKREAEQMNAVIATNDLVVALDRRGRHLQTSELAKHQQRWIDEAQNVSMLIGGPEGIDQHSLERADLTWSFSKFTFPHALMRVLLAEQWFRAWSINAGLPYHRDG